MIRRLILVRRKDMTKKEKEFDFEKSYDELLEKAKKVGLSDDAVFQTMMKEFKRMKSICDELYDGIEKQGVSYTEETFKGREVFKSNPLTNDYVKAHRILVSTCGEIRKIFANIQTNEDDWL